MATLPSVCVLSEPVKESLLVGEELLRPMPKRPLTCLPTSIERKKDERGYNYIVRFPVKSFLRALLQGSKRCGLTLDTVKYRAMRQMLRGLGSRMCW